MKNEVILASFSFIPTPTFALHARSLSLALAFLCYNPVTQNRTGLRAQRSDSSTMDDDGPAEVDLSPQEFLDQFLPQEFDFRTLSAQEVVVGRMRDGFVGGEAEDQRLELLVSPGMF